MYYSFIFIYLLFNLAYPTVREESFGVITICIFFSPYGVITRLCSIIYIKAVNTIGTYFFYCICFCAFDIALFGSHFCSPFIPWDRITIIYHGVELLGVVVELDGFATLGIAAGACFYRFIGLLRGVLFRVDFKYFTLFWRVSGAMQHACLFCSGGSTTWMACIFCLTLASVYLLGVGRRCSFSYLSFPDMAGTVGICPSGYCRRCFPFLDLFINFHVIENWTGFPVGIQLKIPTL